MAEQKDEWQDVAKGLQAKAVARPPAVGSVMVDAAQEIVRLRALVEDLSLKLIAAEQAARAAGEERDALREFYTAAVSLDIVTRVDGRMSSSFDDASRRLWAAREAVRRLQEAAMAAVAGGPGGAEEGAGPT